jgi:hypothetical protein
LTELLAQFILELTGQSDYHPGRFCGQRERNDALDGLENENASLCC